MSPCAGRGLVLPTVAALAVFAVLIGLGVWQVERKAWKEGLIAVIDQRVAAPPEELPPPETWARLTPQADEFRHVKFRAHFAGGLGVSVYAAGSALRNDVSSPGYFVFRPGQLDNGKAVVVDRGYVPQGTFVEDPDETVDIIGYLRWPERHPWFFPDHDAKSDVWFVRDHIGMAAAATKTWGEVAPFYVAQELPVPPGSLPKPGPIKVMLPNNHLGYAITWFGLALALAGVYIAFVVGRWRRPQDYAAAQHGR